MFFDLDVEQDERLAVKKAVALAVSRYNDTIGKFVQGKPDRLEIVDNKIARISLECAEQSKADIEEVDRLFRKHLAEVAVTNPEKQNVSDSAEYTNSEEVPQPEHGVRDDIKGSEPVLDGDADGHIDLNENSSLSQDEVNQRRRAEKPITSAKEANPQATTCPYCGHMMTPTQNAANPAMSGQSQQCPNCGAQVMATPGTGMGAGQPGFQQGMQTGIGGGLYAKCARCEKEAADEGSILCVACNHFVITGESSCGCDCEQCRDGDHCEGPQCHEKSPHYDDDGKPKDSSVKEGQGGLEDPDMPDDNVQSPAEENAPQQQLPPAVENDSNGPAEVYTATVQDMANSGAASAWSTPGDEDINQISEQYGIDPDEVRKNLVIVADFGDAVAVNGDPNADPQVDGMFELPDFGGRIPSTEEEVDSQNAISHTADRTGLSPDDVYALVKESYGDDIGGQHYVSVNGEAHYYLPQELVPQQAQQQPDQDSPQETPADAYQSSVPAHLRSLAAYLEWEQAQTVASA